MERTQASQRSQENTAGDRPQKAPAYGYYASLKPQKKGKVNMSRTEWIDFYEVAKRRIQAAGASSLHQGLQTEVAESLLETELARRALMNLRENSSGQTFFNATRRKIESFIDISRGQGSCLTIPSCNKCDGVSRDRQKKDWSKKGLASAKGSQRKSHSLLAQASPRQDRPVSMGCYRCTQFGHFVKECPANPESLKCNGCHSAGHIEEVCPKTRPRQKSWSRRRPSRPSSTVRTPVEALKREKSNPGVPERSCHETMRPSCSQGHPPHPIRTPKTHRPAPHPEDAPRTETKPVAEAPWG